jgi:uncharacterized membrane protein YoaK (UPF0700 family)
MIGLIKMVLSLNFIVGAILGIVFGETFKPIQRLLAIFNKKND